MNLSFLSYENELSQERKQEIDQLQIIPKGKSQFEVGDVFNHLTILGRAENSPKYRNTYVYAICDCKEHNIIKAQLNKLRSGNTTSCGCEHKKAAAKQGAASYIDMLGQQIGSFQIIQKTEERDFESVVWLGKCIYCGEYRKISQRNMKNNILHPNICGCQRKDGSSFEQKLSFILEKNNIVFIKEKTFENFIYQDTQSYPRFDFFLPKYNCLIEVHGKQHYIQGTGFMKKEDLDRRKKRDLIKINWALENNYKMIVIPYYEIEKITIEDLLPDSKFEIIKGE